jgi:hypothetical protein
MVSVVVDGQMVRIPAVDLLTLNPTELEPVRRFAAYRKQQRNPGVFWSAKTSHFVPYESRMEAQHLLVADFDPRVVHIVAQPFRLHFQHDGAWKSHVPDFLLVLRNDGHEVVNVGIRKRLEQPGVRLRLSQLAATCQRLGWHARVAQGPVEQPMLANLRYLAAARLAPCGTDELGPALLQACRTATRWGDVEAASPQPPAMVRAVIVHLLWHHRLHTDLGIRLTADSLLEAS